MALQLKGERHTGQTVRDTNVMAAQSIANVVKSSLGPVGLDKMLVNEIGDVTITNDGATILKLLEVEHPAGKVLVELSNLQDAEVGDGTTSVVILAAELLKRANELVKQGIHPTTVISGFIRAKKEACKFIAKSLTTKIDNIKDRDIVVQATKTSLSSKLINTEVEFFTKLCVDAMYQVQTKNARGQTKYPVKAVNILKVTGGGFRDSKLVAGYALEQTRSGQGMVKRVDNAKIALIGFDLRKKPLKFGVQMIIEDPKEIQKMRQTEIDACKKKCDILLNAGANVIITTGGIDDVANKYMIDKGAMGFRRVSKSHAKRIAKLTGGKYIVSLGDDEGEDSIDPSILGTAKCVHEETVGDRDVAFVSGCSTTAAATLLIRGSNYYMMDEVERSVHDCLCVIKRVLESKRVVPGGGAVEAAVCIHLESVAESMASKEQLAVAEYAQAMLVIPNTLALNGAHDALDLVAKLKGYHAQAQLDSNTKSENNYIGLDLKKGTVRNNLKAGVIEPAMSKIKQLQFATEAAVTILRIDDSISVNKAPGGQG